MTTCYIGVDVGLTSAKVAAFDDAGTELRTVSAPNPRMAVAADRQEIDMDALWGVVATCLRELTGWLTEHGYTPRGMAVTGHGNGLYPVDASLRPVRPAIASTDTRAAAIAERAAQEIDDELRDLTGSMPWAAQPAVLLSWLAAEEPSTYARITWALSCKDWITTCLTGSPSADVSDASAMGITRLRDQEYLPQAFELVGLPGDAVSRFPRLRRSDEVTGRISPTAATATGLPAGLPVAAGSMDCVASPLGAGASRLGDVTIIVGTWAINALVVPSDRTPPRVTLNGLLPDPATMLAMEVAPTSSASVEWLADVVSTPGALRVTPRDLLEQAESAPAGSDGLFFLPFVHGGPGLHGATGTLVGATGLHGHAHVARAVAEGVAQYHRVQVEALRASGAPMSSEPWTLAGGGARNAVWAQIFADVLGHPVRRQLEGELGARGAASLARAAVEPGAAPWTADRDPRLVVTPGPDRATYVDQSRTFDALLAAMAPAWAAQADAARR